MNWPGVEAATVAVKLAWPLSSVVTMASPSQYWPSP